MENEFARVDLLLGSLDFDKITLSFLLPTRESIQANREAGFEETAKTLAAIRKTRIRKHPGIVDTEKAVMERISATTIELRRLGVHV